MQDDTTPGVHHKPPSLCLLLATLILGPRELLFSSLLLKTGLLLSSTKNAIEKKVSVEKKF